MADFSPPFSSVGGVNRSPTVDEQSDGFTCGAADLTLFNRLFGRIEAELKAIQDEGGITGSEEDDTTVLQAIQAMIAAATGGGDTSQFVLFTQAQARLPIFPEVTTNNGVIAVTSPSTGTVRVPASATVLHRGIRSITTAETDFVTTSSKTYHLRCAISAGTLTFSLKDVSDGVYNPTAAAETSAIFDSTYDDMLVARVVTNSSNVATITNLINKNAYQTVLSGNMSVANPATLITATGTVTLTHNLARTPRIVPYPATLSVSPTVASSSFAATDRHDHDHQLTYTTTRYNTAITFARDYLIAGSMAALISMMGN